MKQSKKGMLMAALICGTIAPVVFSGASVFAAEKDEVDDALQAFTLDPMVVTSQRRETKDLDTPASTIVISDKKIQEAGYKNVFDAIEHQVGLASTGYGDAGQTFGAGNYSRTIIRGYDKGTLVLVDGIPVNLKNLNNGIDSVPIDMVKKIEIVKGASGTLYGADAMGGVINIITKRPEGKPHFKIKGTVGNYYKDYGVTYSDSKFIASFQREYANNRNRSNDYPNGSETVWWVGKGQKNRAAVAANITDELTANFMFMDNTVTRGGTKYKDKNMTTPSTKYNYSYKDRRITTGLHYEGKTNGIKATLGYNAFKADGNSYTSKTSPYTSGNSRQDSWIFDVQKKFDFGKNNLIVGYTYKREGYETFHENKASDVYHGHRNNNALYLSYTQVFSDRFSTTLGLRGEHINSVLGSRNVVNPQIQTLYKINDSTSWFINIGRGFQMPTIDTELKNKDKGTTIKPESGWTYETGIKKTFGDDKSLKLSVYHMEFKDKLAWTPVQWRDNFGIPQRQYNAGTYKNTGVEIEYAQRFNDHWDFSAAFGYSNPVMHGSSADPAVAERFTSNSTRYSSDAGQGLARLDGSISLTYRNKKVTSSLSYKYLGDREEYKVWGVNRQIPNKSRLTWHTNYNFTKNDSLSLTLNNIFDRKNYSNPYGNLELPFNWLLTYSHTF